MKHVVMFSGGIGSWATAQRVIDKYGPDAVTLLFADVLGEDQDCYRSTTSNGAAADASPIRR